MTNQATKPETTNASRPAAKPAEPVGVFTKDYYSAFGCFRAGQRITRKVAKAHWEEWLRSGLIRVL